MIERFSQDTLYQICSHCGTKNTIKLNYGLTVLFDNEKNEYSNLRLPQCECGSIEVLNMNIENEEFDYDEIEALNIPFKEIVHRKYVRDIILLHREDFKLKAKSVDSGGIVRIVEEDKANEIEEQ
ncbi:hypothetical protein [Halalkalibacter krulwichiae]|uniref:Uncharacterized protein n=1 Tax=Halalkalibacter krulwichiae TaxID=199441 RepID=A0A1X9MF87_9BACI|nr:hypothetical protein [Halalkalibacter krulwichiae]ARK32115.1 hypothetical protein BkAM31D_20975 [Halalkalibacter krulwichiae]